MNRSLVRIPGAAVAPVVPAPAGLARLLLDARRAYRGGPAAVAARQQARLAEQIAFARTCSPYYRELYRGLPSNVDDAALLPVTGKAQLMAHFDDWVTDPRATQAEVQAFVEDPTRIGDEFLDAYAVATTSGTTGTRGVFLLDKQSLAVATAMSGRVLANWLRPSDLVRIAIGGGRIALVTATGGHFASTAAAARLRSSPRTAERVQAYSVQTPLPELVAQLNAFRPAVLAPYASTAALLAGEQEAGGLDIHPALIVLSAEGLPDREYQRIAAAFDTKVGHSYAATECPFLSYSCREGWLHVNADWAILEPVDADHRPTLPGQQSHTVLVTNLANRIQPILRYDLGDSVLTRPEPCPCGNPLPAIRVQGRTADLLTFPSPHGPITITPLTLSALLDRVPGIEVFQIIHAAPTTLRVRLRPRTGIDPEQAWQTAHSALADLLANRRLEHVDIERADEPPLPSAGGKYRLLQPLAPQ